MILGIDNGTQSTKVLFYDPEKREIAAMASANHELISGNDGCREQRAEWWTDALKSCMDRVDPEIRSRVKAVGVSGQQHGFVPIDEQGNPLHRVKLWCDTSTAAECNELTAKFGGREKLLSEVGNLIAPGFTASKILWLKKRHPELFEQMRWVLLPHDYLNFWLTGEAAMEYGDASGTALLDIRGRVWHKELIRCIDDALPDKLPRLIPPDAVMGRISKQAAALTGLPEQTPVSSGGGDNMMGAIGTGAVRNGVMTMSLGTSGTLYGCSDKPIVDEDGILAAFCSSSNSWLPLLCTMNCTVASELTRDFLKMSLEEINEAGSGAPIGAEGVCMLPFFNGERVPNLPHARGSIMGLNSLNFKRANIIRASMESAVFGLKTGLDRFRELGFKVTEIRLIGGGARSKLWRQMAADVLDLPVLIPRQPESAAFGAALQALWMLHGGGEKTLFSLTDEHVVLDDASACKPDAARSELYKGAYAHYKQWGDRLAPFYRTPYSNGTMPDKPIP